RLSTPRTLKCGGKLSAHVVNFRLSRLSAHLQAAHLCLKRLYVARHLGGQLSSLALRSLHFFASHLQGLPFTSKPCIGQLHACRPQLSSQVGRTFNYGWRRRLAKRGGGASVSRLPLLHVFGDRRKATSTELLPHCGQGGLDALGVEGVGYSQDVLLRNCHARAPFCMLYVVSYNIQHTKTIQMIVGRRHPPAGELELHAPMLADLRQGSAARGQGRAGGQACPPTSGWIARYGHEKQRWPGPRRSSTSRRNRG